MKTAENNNRPLITAHRLTRRFGSLPAVDDVSFDIEAGEIVGLLGPNGAGKSTLLRVLAGYLPPTSGSVRVAGYDIVTESLAARRRLGYLPEQFALYRDMHVYDYLKYRAGLRGLGGSERRRRVMAMLEKCALESVAGDCIGSLSRGYWQRVGLADAMVHDPPVLLLDEPALGLDPTQAAQLRALLSASSANRAVLFSSHGLPDVERLCTRVMIMNAGRIAASDTPDNLIERWRGRRVFIAAVRGQPQAFLEACRRLETVHAASIEGGTPWSRITIETFKQADLGGQLFELAVSSGCVLGELRRRNVGLDDVFTALTCAENSTTP